MWTWIYDFNVGVLNDLLLRVGVISAPAPWLAQPSTALTCVMLALVWQGFPFFTVMILAGLQTVPAELYEAAEIDGLRRGVSSSTLPCPPSRALSRRRFCFASFGSPTPSTSFL